jgi:hypothetical protein
MGEAEPPRAGALPGPHPDHRRLEREGQPTLFRLRTSGLADLDTAGQFCEQVRARGGNCVPVR